MKGATAELPPNTSSAPIIIRKRMMGIIHHFFRLTRNLHRSLKNSIFVGFGEGRLGIGGWGLGVGDWGLGCLLYYLLERGTSQNSTDP